MAEHQELAIMSGKSWSKNRANEAGYSCCTKGTSQIANYSQQDATFLNIFIFYRRSTCFRRFLRPSSGAH